MGMVTGLAVISGGLAIGQILPFIRSTIRGTTKPSRVACAISVACNVLTVISMLTSKTNSGLVLPAVFTLTGTISFLLAIKFGVSGFTRSDIIAGAVAAVTIATWLIVGGNAAVIGTNIAQTTAVIAVFNKLRANPGTEDLYSWSIGGTAAVLSLAAIVLSNGGLNGLTLAAIALPLRCVLSCIAILTLAACQRRAACGGIRKAGLRTVLGWLRLHHIPLFRPQPDFNLAA